MSTIDLCNWRFSFGGSPAQLAGTAHYRAPDTVEIGASKIVVPAGQVLFHGRGDMHLHDQQPYPSFVSASLDPTVCSYHATKRKLQNDANAKAVIYLLTLRDALPAMWGNGGDLDEWELLLQSGLTCTMTAVHHEQRFDIVEATMGV